MGGAARFLGQASGRDSQGSPLRWVRCAPAPSTSANPLPLPFPGAQQPPPMDLGAAMGMGQVPFQQPSERVFCGGLPYYLTEEQCRELLGAFGAIRSFDLIKDKETGQSKG